MAVGSTLERLPILALAGLAVAWLDETQDVPFRRVGGALWVLALRQQDPPGVEIVILPVESGRSSQHHAAIREISQKAAKDYALPVTQLRIIDLRGERTRPESLVPKDLRHLPLMVWRATDLADALHRSPMGDRLGAWESRKKALSERVPQSALLTRFLSDELRADQYTHLSAAGGDAQRRTRLARVFVDLRIDPDQSHQQGQPPPRTLAATALASAALPRTTGDFNGQLMGMAGRARGTGRVRSRFLLIGGPGQGKTTLGIYLCQLHRAALLEAYGVGVPAEAKEILSELRASGGADAVLCRRLPIRVVLHKYADALAKGEVADLWGYLERYARVRIGEASITADLLRAWLRAWPSLIVLDGLDEVPASANRDPMLATIERFLGELERASADVFVVATSRPQGYRGELSGEGWEQHTIQDFSAKEAEDYSKLLLQEWVRTDRVRREELAGRMQRAVAESATSHLARSPLQVMILTILVEQTGRPPRDRWRLFKEYFRIIFDRERERGIPAVEVLREQQDLIERLHAEVGYRLQLAAERATGTSSGMEVGELEGVIRQMLAEDGQRGESLEQLVFRIREAAIDRLVFLVGHAADRVGFEIRSLQEFQAAERLFWGEEGLLPRRLEAIAPSTHWRNVLLFAAGRIAAERPHLLERIPQLCDSVDRLEGGWGGRVRLGARLAVDLLGEGSLASRPKVREALVKRALEGSCEQDVGYAEEIARNLGTEVRSELIDFLQRGPSPLSREKWAILVEWAAAGDADALALLIEHLRRGGPRGWEALAEWQWVLEPAQVAPLLRGHAGPLPLKSAIDLANQRYGHGLPDLWTAPYIPAYSDPIPLSSGVGQGHAWLTIGSDVQSADDLLCIEDERAALRAVQAFNSQPTAEHLGKALMGLHALNNAALQTRLSDLAHWALRACLLPGAGPLSDLSERATRGELGTHEDWSAMETRLRTGGVTLSDLESLGTPAVPLSPGLRRQGLPRGVEIYLRDQRAIQVGYLHLWGMLARDPHACTVHRGALNTDESLVWDLPRGVTQYSVEVELFRRALRSPDNPRWVNRLARRCLEALDAREPLGLPYLDDEDRPGEQTIRALALQVPHYPPLLLLLVTLAERGLLAPSSLSWPEDAKLTDPRLAALLSLLQVATVTHDAAPALGARLIDQAPLLPDVWSRVSALCLNQHPEGAISLLQYLLERVDGPDISLLNALRALLNARPAPVHDPVRAASLGLPAPTSPTPTAASTAESADPVHLQALHIQNLRAWETLDLTFSTDPTRGQWLFFVGENGTGKTTLLRALALALVGPATGAGLLAQTPGSMVRNGAEHGKVKLSLLDGQKASASIHDDALVPNGPAPDLLVVGYGPRRGTLLGVTRQELNFNPMEAVETLFIEGGNLIHAETWLQTLDHRALKSGNDADQQVLAAVKALLIKVLPGVERVEIGPDAVRVSGRHVGDVPLKAVSDGYLTTAGWIVDLIARWMERERVAGRPPAANFAEQMTGIVLIDEVDLHLHPRWQRLMVDDVRALFPRLTFIVTTHNPVTLLGAREGEIWVIERDERGHLGAVQRDIPPGTGVEAILTGAVFGLPSALDNDTVRLLDRHRELLRQAPESDERNQVEVELRRRLGRFADTSLEGVAQSVVAQELRERADQLTPADRERARQKAREALRRMVREAT